MMFRNIKSLSVDQWLYIGASKEVYHTGELYGIHEGTVVPTNLNVNIQIEVIVIQ